MTADVTAEELFHDVLDRPRHAPSDWEPIDLGPALRGEAIDARPTILARTDGACLAYPGKIHALYGEPESAKGWIVMGECVEQMHLGFPVIYIDFEDTATTAVSRLLALGATPEEIRELFIYIRPDTPATSDIVAGLPGIGATFAVIDGVTEAMTLHDLDLRDNGDSARFVALLCRPLADQGCSVWQVDHVTKDRDGRGRFAIGAQHKLAGIDGAAYMLEVIQPFGRGMQGVSRLTVAKDRPGFVRPVSLYGKSAGDVHLSSDANGTVRVRIDPAAGVGGFRPTHLMERVSRYLEIVTEPVSSAEIEREVTGKSVAVRRAIDLLATEGFTKRSPGPHGAILHELGKPFREVEP